MRTDFPNFGNLENLHWKISTPFPFLKKEGWKNQSVELDFLKRKGCNK